MKKNKKIFFATLFLAVFLASANFVYALEATYPTVFGLGIGSGTLPEYAKYFFNIGIALAGFLAIIVIAWGGIQYMFTLGIGKIIDPSKGTRGPAEAKEWVKAGIIGLLLTVSAYLIAYTINPYLVIFDLKGLAPLTFLANMFSSPSPSVPSQVYDEIPIGTLTENLLSGTMDCYNYDGNGDPIDGPQITTDNNQTIPSPTYLNHDRVDCFAKLAQAAAAKALIIKNLSDAITSLMKNSCSCGNSYTAPKPTSKNPQPLYTANGPGCKNFCAPASTINKNSNGQTTDCKFPGAPACPSWASNCLGSTKPCQDSCSNQGACSSNGGNCCDPNAKQKMENGPINLGCASGTTSSTIDTNSDYNLADSAALLSNGVSLNDAKILLAQFMPPGQCNCGIATNGDVIIGRLDANGSCICSGVISCPAGECPDPNGSLSCSPEYCGASASSSSSSSNGGTSGGNSGQCGTCGGSSKNYLGLDEFRSKFNNSYLSIKSFVEKQYQVNGKQISVINNGNCGTCTYNCSGTCDRSTMTIYNYNVCIKNQNTCQKNQTNCLTQQQNCLKQNSPWYNLRLVDQITYLQGKMADIKQAVQQDLDNLNKGETSLGQCYLADTYDDFLKTYNQTDKQDKTILVERPFSEFSGPESETQVNPAKYCQGFEFNNSTCYSQCQKVCPGTQDDFKNYASCGNCDVGDKNCFTKQADCVKKAYDNRGCTSGASPFSTFPQCMTNCKQQCLNSCNQKCGEDQSQCISDCNNNSQCLANNEGTCLVDFNQLHNCTSESACENLCNKNQDCINNCKENYDDPDFKQNCVNNSATLCRYCSDQYAGYPDCLISSYSLKSNYSSSFIYQHSDYQVCSNINKTNNNSNKKDAATCLTLHPETAECPSASKCPLCPCDTVNEPINYLTKPAPAKPKEDACNMGSASSGSTNSNSNTAASSGGGSTTVSEYRVCSGTCDTFSYNDDPLTFYCQQSWWFKTETKNTTPIGADMVCNKDGEIPVGQTVDDAETWAQDFMNNIDKVTQKVQGLESYMQNIGNRNKQSYCQCGSKCETTNSSGQQGAVCQAKCTFQQTAATTKPGTPSPGDAAGATPEPVEVPAKCFCARSNSCSGNPCQLMIDLLDGPVYSNESCAKNAVGMESFYVDMANAVKDFTIFTVQQNRSDIVKELNYSRQETNQCSTVQNNYGPATRLLDCTRVEDEIISPIVGSSNPGAAIVNGKSTSSYCYGKALGGIMQTANPLMDNWFCCQEIQKGGTGQQQTQPQQ